MEQNRELLLQIKNGENLYKQFYFGKEYDHSESIFSLVEETINQLIKKMDGNAPQIELQELLRKRFIKTGWKTFLQDMEYVRPNNPENEVHDSINKLYYNQIGRAIGLDNFESYLKNPKANVQIILTAQKQSISKLKGLAEYHDINTVLKIEVVFQTCFKEVDTAKFDKGKVLESFGKLLDEISDLGIVDTDDREIIAEIIQDCLISYGFEDSDGLLEKYL